jgi:hypothetical protein
MMRNRAVHVKTTGRSARVRSAPSHEAPGDWTGCRTSGYRAVIGACTIDGDDLAASMEIVAPTPSA